ncbi:hypothetical protein [Variovorax sp. DAIF25]
MVDAILFIFTVGVFAAGFWLGKTFGTIKAAVSAAGTWVKSLFQ